MSNPNDLASNRGLHSLAKTINLRSSIKILGSSVILGLVTWGLTNFISFKNNQQEQLNAYIKAISEFMVHEHIYNKPPPISVLRAARGYTSNTLATLSGIGPLEDKSKKIALISFLYESSLIGYCPVQDGSSSSADETEKILCTTSQLSLKDANLESLIFADLSDPKPAKTWAGIDLTGANLNRSNFKKAILFNSRFDYAKLRSASFESADLSHAQFKKADLRNANFNDAILDQTNFNGSILCGADFTEAPANLEPSFFKDAIFDRSTKFPSILKTKLMNQNPLIYTKQCIVSASAHS